jgi:putative redox protein
MPTRIKPAASQKIEFENSRGVKIAAALDLPKSSIRAFAVFAHCFSCSKDFAASRHIANALQNEGIAVLRVDFTGLGHSDGEFSNSNFSTNLDDLQAACAWLSQHHRPPELLIGHSLGGAASLMAALDMPNIKAVATIGAPSAPDHVLHLLGDKRDDIERNGEAEVLLGGRPFKIRQQFLDDVRAFDLTKRLPELKADLLVCHSPIDAIVGIENAQDIFLAARHPKSFMSLDQADHLLSKPGDAAYLAGVISAWAARHFPSADKLYDDAGHVIAAESGEGPLHLNVNAAGHALQIDEPESVGGTDRGPSPYDLLGAALGGCTTLTLRLYANRKKLDVEHIETYVDHEKRHVNDCEQCEDGNKRVDHFDRRIKIVGDITDAQRQRMLEIADMCPVHRTLEQSSHISTGWAEE